MAGQNYKIIYEGGQVMRGQLDADGHARHDNVPEPAWRVEYEPRLPLPEQPWALSPLVAAAQSKLG
jgi:type VI secretion system secreted protein VgrG